MFKIMVYLIFKLFNFQTLNVELTSVVIITVVFILLLLTVTSDLITALLI